MNKKVKITLISSGAAIITAALGVFGGMQISKVITYGQINEVIGDNNTVNFNNIGDFIEDYQKIKSQNEYLIAQNGQYFEELETLRSNSDESAEKSSDEITRLNDEIVRLNDEINAFPNIQFKSVGLSIDGNSMPINTTDSSVIIDNKIYYAEDFIYNIIGSGIKVSVQDDVMYIGKIIKDQALLSEQTIVDRDGVYIDQNIKDSYGNTHANSLYFNNKKSSIIYNLNEDYSFIKFSLSIYENATIDKTGILTIKADGEIVYTSPALTKTTKQIDVADVPINNCTLLIIEYSTESLNNECIVSDIIVYN